MSAYIGTQALTGKDPANCEVTKVMSKDLWVRRLSAF